jgi:hypothetical protein
MRSSDFREAVSPAMGRRELKGGGRAAPRHVTAVIMPAGALGGGSGAPPMHPIQQEIHEVAEQMIDLMQRVRALPGLHIPTFDQGAMSMVRGLHTIRSAMQKSGR